MGEKFSWERLLKRNGAEATDNTIDLVPDAAPMGPVAPLQASRPPVAPPVDSADCGKPRPPLVIDWDEYQQLEQANPVAVHSQAADVPPTTSVANSAPPVSALESPTQVAAPVNSVAPTVPVPTPEPPVLSTPESSSSTPVNQFWDKLGDATNQAFSAPHAPSDAPVVAGWDDVELTPREKDGAMRISSDHLAGTVDPDSFKPISPQPTIEQTIQSISQSSAWDELDSVVSAAPQIPPTLETPTVTETPLAPPPVFKAPRSTPRISDEPDTDASEPSPISFEVSQTNDLPPAGSLPPVAEDPAVSTSSFASPPPAEPSVPVPNPVGTPNTSTFWDSILAPQPADSVSGSALSDEQVVEAPAPEASAPRELAECHSAPATQEVDSAPPVNPVPATPEPAPQVTASTPADSLYELPNDDAALHEARDIRLGEVLVNHRLVTESQIARAMEIQQQSGKRLGEVLVSLGMVSERRLLQVLAAQKGVSPWHLDEDPPTTDALRSVPHDLCRLHRVIPVSVRGELLLLAMRDTQDLAAIEAVRSFTGRRVEPVLADESLLAQAIEKASGQMSTADWIQAEEEAFDAAPIAPIASVEEIAEPAPEPKSLLQDLPKLDSVESAMNWLVEEESVDAEPIVAMPEQFDFVPPAVVPEQPEPEATHSHVGIEVPETADASEAQTPEPLGLESADEPVEVAFSGNEFENESTGAGLEANAEIPNSWTELPEVPEAADTPELVGNEVGGEADTNAFDENKRESEPTAWGQEPELFVHDQSVYNSVYTPESIVEGSKQPELDSEPRQAVEPEAPAAESTDVEVAKHFESDHDEFARDEEPEPLNWHGSDLAAQSEAEIDFDPLAEESRSTEEPEAAELAEVIEEVSAEEEFLAIDAPDPVESEIQAEEAMEEVLATRAVDLCAVLSQAAELDARSAHIQLRGGSASINIRTRCGSNATQLISTEELDHVLNEIQAQIACDPRQIAPGDSNSFNAYLDDFEFEVQVSTLVTSLGFQVKLAFPRPKLSLLNWRELGLETENAKLVESLIHQPYGLFLIAGPSDSGKTTTLYSLAAELHRCGCTVVCCESEIQAALEDVEQVEFVDQDLKTILHSVLEQGPDRVFVGEITDATSANLVIDAALAGCAVIATIRAQDTSDVLRILGEWGVPPFRLARALNGVLAQRLIRTLGDGSYRTNEMTSAEAESLKTYFGNTQIRELPRAASTADWDGYRGRTAIHEVFVNSEETAALLAAGQPIDQVIEAAGYYGYLPIRFDGLRRIAQGETTLDELRRTITLRPLRKSEPRTLAS